MPHSQRVYNNPYPELNKPILLRSIIILSSHIPLSFPKGLFPVVFPANIYGITRNNKKLLSIINNDVQELERFIHLDSKMTRDCG
jgi:hypothetical protein